MSQPVPERSSERTVWRMRSCGTCSCEAIWQMYCAYRSLWVPRFTVSCVAACTRCIASRMPPVPKRARSTQLTMLDMRIVGK